MVLAHHYDNEKPMKFWVNVYKPLYEGMGAYLSMGYPTRKKALEAVGKGRGKSIRERYITTVKITIYGKAENQN